MKVVEQRAELIWVTPKSLIKPYYYDIQYTKGSEKRTIKKDKFVVEQDIGK